MFKSGRIEPEYGLSEQGYRLSPEQAQAILDFRLHRFTALNKIKFSMNTMNY